MQQSIVVMVVGDILFLKVLYLLESVLHKDGLDLIKIYIVTVSFLFQCTRLYIESNLMVVKATSTIVKYCIPFDILYI